MKNTLIIIAILLTGCGSVDSNDPKPVEGAWSGIIYESESFRNVITIRIKDENVVGGHELVHLPTSTSNFYTLTGLIVGDEEGFSLVINIGGNVNNNWAFTGYVKNGELCLIRDVLPEPVRCLAPLG